MKREYTLHVRLMSTYFCLLSAITFMLLKYMVVDNWLYKYTAMKLASQLPVTNHVKEKIDIANTLWIKK